MIVLSRVTSPTTSPFFFNDPAPTDLYTLSLHDALPICSRHKNASGQTARLGTRAGRCSKDRRSSGECPREFCPWPKFSRAFADRKSTRLNSSHVSISYAVFCLKKKKKYNTEVLYSKLIL